MELETRRIRGLEMKKTVVDQFYIDEEFNVPDSKEDVRRILLGKGEVRIEDTSRAEAYVKVSGKIFYRIVYLPDHAEPLPAFLEGSLPFEEMIYLEEEGEEGQELQQIRVSRLEFTPGLIHSRKLSLRVMVEVQVFRDLMKEEELTVGVPEDQNLCCKKKAGSVLELKVSQKDRYRIKEEMKLPKTKENIGQILYGDVDCRSLSIRILEEELQLKGELSVFCLYLSEDGKTDWSEQRVPYEGKVEVSGAKEGMIDQISSELRDVSLEVRMDEDGEMRVVGVEGTLFLQICLYEETKMELVEDVYAPGMHCETKTTDGIYEQLLIRNQLQYKLEEQLLLPELGEGTLQICHGDGSIQMEQTKVMEEGIYIEGILYLNFLYLKAEDEMPFASWSGMVPFSYLLECPKQEEELCYHISPGVEQISFGLLGGQNVEVKAVLSFDALIRTRTQQKVLREVELTPFTREEMERRPGIVGYIVKEGDTLWDLAKRYQTTEEKIKAVNGMEREELEKGEKLILY